MKEKYSRHASLWILVGFCLCLAAFVSRRTDHFLSLKNLVNILEATSYRLILAVGMTFIIGSGAIDLSVGSILSLSSIVMAMLMRGGMPVAWAVMVGLLFGAALGAVNGAVIYLTRINSLIITLATSFLYRGLCLILTLGSPVTRLPKAFLRFGSGDLFGMESGVTMATVILLVSFPLMYRMRWGHYLTALGGNAEALKRSGAPIARYRIGSFAAMGALAALAGVIITARLNSAEPNAGLEMEMSAITAVIMGGTPLSGGYAQLAGTAVAVFLLGLIRNGLTMMSISSYYLQFITGGLLLIAVVAAELRERRNRIL